MFSNLFKNCSRLAATNLRQVLFKQNIHVSTVICAKKYRRFETEFNYKFVNNYETIKSTDKQERRQFQLEENYKEKSTSELVQTFEDLSYHCQQTQTCISEEKFNGLIQQLIARLKDFDDEQVMKIIFDLNRFPDTVRLQLQFDSQSFLSV